MHSFRSRILSFFLVAVIATCVVFPRDLYAIQAALPPFGGMTILNIPCTCSYGIGTVIWLPTPASVINVPGYSTIYQWFTPVVGAWQLGQYHEWFPCLLGAAPFCFPFPTQGAIFHTGTSIPGADVVGI